MIQNTWGKAAVLRGIRRCCGSRWSSFRPFKVGSPSIYAHSRGRNESTVAGIVEKQIRDSSSADSQSHKAQRVVPFPRFVPVQVQGTLVTDRSSPAEARNSGAGSSWLRACNELEESRGMNEHHNHRSIATEKSQPHLPRGGQASERGSRPKEQ